MWPPFIQEIVIAMKNIGRNIGKASNFGEVGTATEHTAWKFWTVWISIRRDIHYLRARNRTHRSFRVSSREMQWNQSEPSNAMPQCMIPSIKLDHAPILLTSPRSVMVSPRLHWPYHISTLGLSHCRLHGGSTIAADSLCRRTFSLINQGFVSGVEIPRANHWRSNLSILIRRVPQRMFSIAHCETLSCCSVTPPKKGTEKCSALRGRRGH